MAHHALHDLFGWAENSGDILPQGREARSVLFLGQADIALYP